MNIIILERQSLSGIGALSGVACIGEDIYFVGDDFHYLLKTNLRNLINCNTVFEKIPLFEQLTQIQLVPLSKSEKPDFEALTCIEIDGQQTLLVMGSGSTENRKQALIFNPSNHQTRKLINAVDYNFLAKSHALTGSANLNIEAICSDNQNLYIFQRGNINSHHGVLVFDLAQIQDGKSLEKSFVNALNLQLPDIDGSASGISDACFLMDKKLIVATAAVEQTTSTYDDGEVLGSFIVVLSTDGKTLATQIIQDDQGQTVPIKVEGITWLESTVDGEVFLLCTDSDGGDSEVLRVLVNSSAFANSLY
ncbi:MAG: hypothetical protein H7Z73_05895 [Candidatus Saccharibacteria bacterium]|nr:hypothetical protein [Moraxellaceae bacterium]